MPKPITTTTIIHCANRFCQSRYVDVWTTEFDDSTKTTRMSVSCSCCGLRFAAERGPKDLKARFVPGTTVTT